MNGHGLVAGGTDAGLVATLGQSDPSGAIMLLGCGMFIAMIAALVGAAACGRIATRPTTSTLGVWSLGTVLLAFALPMVVIVVASIAKLIERGTPGHAVFSAVVVLSMVLGSLAGVVMAIVALARYGQHDPPLEQGRAQAIWAIVLGVLLVLGFAGLFVGGMVAGALDARANVTAVEAGDTLRFEELNFEVEAPGRPWVSMATEAINPDAAVVLRRNRPEVLWMVIAETDPGGGLFDLDLLLEVVKANMAGEADHVDFGDPVNTTLDGLPAVRMTATGRMGMQAFAYEYHLLSHNGFNYQLITFSTHDLMSRVKDESRAMAKRFRMLDRQRVAGGVSNAVDGDPVAELNRPDEGFRVGLDPSIWIEWESRREDVPEAAAGAVCRGVGYLAITALPIAGIPVGDQHLIEGFMTDRLFEVSRGSARRLRQGSLRGLSFADVVFRDEEQGLPMTAHVRMMRSGDWAYFVMGWALGENPAVMDELKAAADAVVYDPDAKPWIEPVREADLAVIYNDIGLAAHNDERFDAALGCFRAAHDANPADPSHAYNVMNTLGALSRHADAVEFGERHLERYAGHNYVRALYAQSLRWIDREEHASEEYERLFRDGFDSAYAFDDLLASLRTQGRQRDALDWLDRFVSDHPDAAHELRLWRGWLLSDLGEHEAAIAHFAEAADHPLADATVRGAWINALTTAGRASEAVRLAERLEAEGHGSDEVLFRRGVAELELEWYPEAHASFRRSYDLRADPGTKDYLDYAASLLGRGDNQLLRSRVEPVPIPSRLRRVIERVEEQPWEPEPGHQSAYLQRVMGIDFPAEGQRRITMRRTVRVDDAAALERLSTLQFSFDPGSETFAVNEVVVTDADGNVVERGDPERYFVGAADSNGVHDTDRSATVPVPGLAVGHQLSYTVTWLEDGDTDEFPFERRHFVATAPTRYELVYVTGATDRVAHETHGDIEHAVDTANLQAWLVEAPPVYRWEPLAPDWTQTYPTLIFGPAGQRWDAVAGEYLGRLGPCLDDAPAIEPVAQRVFANADDQRAAVSAAVRHVQRALTYEAIAFGVRGQIPHRVPEILRQRFGDCKDHSLLLWHLLRKRGIDAHLALVNTGEPVAPNLPSLGQFDHMVLYVPGIAPGLILDATDDTHPALDSPPANLDGRYLLVLDPDRPRLITAPNRVTPSTIRTNRRVTVRPDGELTVNETLTFDGFVRESMIGYLTGIAPHDRVRQMQDWMSNRAEVQLEKLDVSDLDALDEPLTLELEYRVADAFRKVGDQLVGRLPCIWERDYLEADTVRDRRTPFRLRYGLVFESGIELRGPDGYTVTGGPTPGKDVTPYLASRIARREGDQAHTIASRIERLPGQHPASAYAAYESATRAALRNLQATHRLVPDPAAAPD